MSDKRDTIKFTGQVMKDHASTHVQFSNDITIRQHVLKPVVNIDVLRADKKLFLS